MDPSYNDEPMAAALASAKASASAANLSMSKPESSFFLDNIIVGYAFGPKKMETMGLIMAEASKALSTFECAGALSSLIQERRMRQQQQQQQQNVASAEHMLEESSMATNSMTDVEKELVAVPAPTPTATRSSTLYFSDGEEDDTRSLSSTYTRASCISQRSGGHTYQQQRGNNNNGINGIQLTFMPDSSGFIHLVPTGSSSGGGGESITGSSITTSATAMTGNTTVAPFRKMGASSAASCSSFPLSLSSSQSRDRNECTNSNVGFGSWHSGNGSSANTMNGTTNGASGPGIQQQKQQQRQHHPIRVSFVPIDLDTPLEEQHGGKFDVILHKMTEDILCMSKMLRSRSRSGSDLETSNSAEEYEKDCVMQPLQTMAEEGEGAAIHSLEHHPPGEDLFEATPSMTRHQARASRRLQRLHEYKQKVHPACVLVDSPNNILAVMSRADMAEVLSRCLAGVTTKGGIPVRTPRFRVVEEHDVNTELSGFSKNGGSESIVEAGDESTSIVDHRQQSIHDKNSTARLADDIDSAGFEYPLIAKPLTAAGTKSSHHMGIVLARDGLQRLKAPCLLQEYANHGEKLFKVYVLGESVWVFSRESLPNLPMGEKEMQINKNADQKRPRSESYVEFERPAGSRCYVEFNSQRPYPKLSDFGIVTVHAAAAAKVDQKSSNDYNILQGRESKFTSGADIGNISNGSSNTQQCDFEDALSERCRDTSKRRRLDVALDSESCRGSRGQEELLAAPLAKINHKCTDVSNDSELARYVTANEIEPVTTALREAFGLEMFGFDVLVKHNNQNDTRRRICDSHDYDDDQHYNDNDDCEKEILVVDVNYFPGYKEVPNFPSLLAQYLTQKAVESRLRNNFDAS